MRLVWKTLILAGAAQPHKLRPNDGLDGDGDGDGDVVGWPHYHAQTVTHPFGQWTMCGKYSILLPDLAALFGIAKFWANEN